MKFVDKYVKALSEQLKNICFVDSSWQEWPLISQKSLNGIPETFAHTTISLSSCSPYEYMSGSAVNCQGIHSKDFLVLLYQRSFPI